jgi:serine phosphatase RsbU (regulator of sigma subunit)
MLKHWFYDLPIKKKMILVMSLVSGIVLVLASTAMLANDVLRFRQNMVEALYSLSELVGLSNSAGVYFGIPDTANDNLKVLAASPRIAEAALFSADGSLFAAYSRTANIKSGKDAPAAAAPPKTLAQYYFATDTPPADREPAQGYFFRNGHLEVFTPIVFEGNRIGVAYLRSDLKAFEDHLQRAGLLLLGVLVAAFFLTILLASAMQRLVTGQVYKLLRTMDEVTRTNDYSRRERKTCNDELGTLCEGFNRMLTHIEGRDQELAKATAEISQLNERLKADNLRMGAELDVTRQLQQMVLPKERELDVFKNLDIACFMEPADEVGGDYYDVLGGVGTDGRVRIGIGDVTGHGLASGVIMLMVQTAVRTLVEYGVTDSKVFLDVLNRTIYRNVQRMGEDKNLTLSMLDYSKEGNLRISGQHEEVLVMRSNGGFERHDTMELGFMVGVMPDIRRMLGEQEIQLKCGDTVVLYTDGITESMNEARELYGLERLSQVIQANCQKTSKEILQAVIGDVANFRGEAKPFDDVTLLVFRRVS